MNFLLTNLFFGMTMIITLKLFYLNFSTVSMILPLAAPVVFVYGKSVPLKNTLGARGNDTCDFRRLPTNARVQISHARLFIKLWLQSPRVFKK